MSSQTPILYADDARDDLRALLAAGRELGPEMDQSLVESYLQKHPAPPAPAPTTRATRRVPGAPTSAYPLLGGIGFLLAAVMFIAILVASGGHAFWLIWLPLVLSGWWWRRWSPHGRWGYRDPYPERPARHDD